MVFKGILARRKSDYNTVGSLMCFNHVWEQAVLSPLCWESKTVMGKPTNAHNSNTKLSLIDVTVCQPYSEM